MPTPPRPTPRPQPKPAPRPAQRPVGHRAPNVHGAAGKSAAQAGRHGGGATWKVGAVGEALTAQTLAQLAEADPHLFVFHDVTLPGIRANIDHLLIRGNKVLILDSKHVAAGTYFTFAGVTRRFGKGGFTQTAHLDKQGTQFNQRLVREALTRLGLPPSAVTSALVLRPAGTGVVSTRFMRLKDGVRAIPATSMPRLVRQVLGTNPDITDNSVLVSWAGALRRS